MKKRLLVAAGVMGLLVLAGCQNTSSSETEQLKQQIAELEQQVTELENLDIVGMVRRVGMTPDQLAALMEAARQSGPLPVLADGEEEPEHD